MDVVLLHIVGHKVRGVYFVCSAVICPQVSMLVEIQSLYCVNEVRLHLSFHSHCSM